MAITIKSWVLLSFHFLTAIVKKAKKETRNLKTGNMVSHIPNALANLVQADKAIMNKALTNSACSPTTQSPSRALSLLIGTVSLESRKPGIRRGVFRSPLYNVIPTVSNNELYFCRLLRVACKCSHN